MIEDDGSPGEAVELPAGCFLGPLVINGRPEDGRSEVSDLIAGFPDKTGFTGADFGAGGTTLGGARGGLAHFDSGGAHFPRVGEADEVWLAADTGVGGSH